MFIADRWNDFEVIDAGDGEKLERWGNILLARPDPQCIWPKRSPEIWKRADAHYERSQHGGGRWEFFRSLPDKWTVRYDSLLFQVRPTGFKHTGLFPEQAANWDFVRQLIRKKSNERNIRVLNLFAYTGGASIACASEGAHVTHLDAAKSIIAWAKENIQLNAIPQERFRFIAEDALAFVQREARRGHSYDIILMDPPSYGRGPNGEVWKLEDQLYQLAEAAVNVLSERPVLLLINSYTTGLQPLVLSDILTYLTASLPVQYIEASEVGLPIHYGGVLPCGAAGRCVFQ